MSDCFEQRRRELDELEERYRAELDRFWREFRADKEKALAEWDEKEAWFKEQSDLALKHYTASISGARARLAEAEAKARHRL